MVQNSMMQRRIWDPGRGGALRGRLTHKKRVNLVI
jgi:hypothetical protein